MSAVAQRLVFAPLPSPDTPAAAVARRVRTAVRLGVLSDGDRLPRESDLARQLGVSMFALREALSELREEGLLDTRSGKNGGSFVRGPADPRLIVQDELLRRSATELRDLGDWRNMLGVRAAELAALRAAAPDVARLDELADQVATASSAEAARRAYGRFHMELAATAQSVRLSHAQLRAQEEFDCLVILCLEGVEQRRAEGTALRKVARAVGVRDVPEARRAVEEQVAAVVAKLSQQRLDLVASRLGSDRFLQTKERPFDEEVHRLAVHYMDLLRDLAAEVTAPLANKVPEPVLEQRVAGAVLARAERLDATVNGVGIIAEVGVVPDHRYWLAWWKREGNGILLQDTHHVMDPSRHDFYDYAAREFMTHPRERHEPWATGPYVDFGGVDDHLVTLSTPIISSGSFLGIAGVDVLVADIERRFASWLARARPPVVLMNADGRVIVSSSPRYVAGDVVTPDVVARGTQLGVFGWTIAVDDCH